MKSLLLCALVGIPLLAESTYKKPPQAVLDVLNAPPTPLISLNPTRTHVLLQQGERYPSIADVSRPMLRLAGLRIDPQSNGPHNNSYGIALTLKGIDDGTEHVLALPAGAKVSGLRWSPNGQKFAFLNTTTSAVQAWVGETATGAVRQLNGVQINAVLGDPLQWMPDSHTLLIQTVPAGRGKPPEKSAPAGPNIQESSGRPAPVRTYQDLLTSPLDEALFDYYATSQMAAFDTANDSLRKLGSPAVLINTEPSPNGQDLLVSRLHKPYSYLHPYIDFPTEVEVWSAAGQVAHKIASLPLADAIPIEGVRVGPRGITWRPNEPATVLWAEAMDGGNPKEKVPHRDRLLQFRAPFQGEPTEFAKTEHRLRGLEWLPNGSMAMITDYERDHKRLRTMLIDAGQPGAVPKIVFDRNVQDRYRDPGRPVTHDLGNGHSVIMQSGDTIFLSGMGASPQGDRPFYDRFNLKTMQPERLFRADEKGFEMVLAPLDDEGRRLLTLRESPQEPPNYFVRDLMSGTLKPLTTFPDRTPQLRGITKKLVTYQRADGVPLSFTLYLPPGYREGTRLPTIVWAYPLEFNDADTAGQVAGSTQRFTSIVGYSHLFLLLNGYAVLDNTAMPVVGDPETVNNTYVEQIVADAKAAIDKAVSLGVTDPQRVGVGGHSYGAFMTANLLANCDLFKAGMARSGAYNRTLTPFGFQSERRTLWEAPEIYMKVSPFLRADKIKTPLLLVHGEADNNPGTFPIQSERMYQAVRGNGGTVRLVMLPNEAHGYVARESTEHTLYEMITWFDKYVKGNSLTVDSAQHD